jgi:hypothetical protein
MSTDKELQKVAAKLDDVSETLEEIRDASACSEEEPVVRKLDRVETDVRRAADAIEDAVDPE